MQADPAPDIDVADAHAEADPDGDSVPDQDDQAPDDAAHAHDHHGRHPIADNASFDHHASFDDDQLAQLNQLLDDHANHGFADDHDVDLDVRLSFTRLSYVLDAHRNLKLRLSRLTPSERDEYERRTFLT